MKGFVKVEITTDELNKIKALTSPIEEWADSFYTSVIQKGWWVFKTEEFTYRKDTPPDGVCVFDWGYPIGMSADIDHWAKNLIKIARLAEAGEDIYLDEDAALTLNKFRSGEYS